MEKPYTILNHPFLDGDEKEKFIDFLMAWASFYRTVDWGEIHISAVIEKIGCTKKEFDEKLFLYSSENVYDTIKRAWVYAQRPMTIREICAMLSNKFSETNIRKQVVKLCKNGYLKTKEFNVMGKKIDFYYLPKE